MSYVPKKPTGSDPESILNRWLWEVFTEHERLGDVPGAVVHRTTRGEAIIPIPTHFKPRETFPPCVQISLNVRSWMSLHGGDARVYPGRALEVSPGFPQWLLFETIIINVIKASGEWVLQVAYPGVPSWTNIFVGHSSRIFGTYRPHAGDATIAGLIGPVKLSKCTTPTVQVDSSITAWLVGLGFTGFDGKVAWTTTGVTGDPDQPGYHASILGAPQVAVFQAAGDAIGHWSVFAWQGGFAGSFIWWAFWKIDSDDATGVTPAGNYTENLSLSFGPVPAGKPITVSVTTVIP